MSSVRTAAVSIAATAVVIAAGLAVATFFALRVPPADDAAAAARLVFATLPIGTCFAGETAAVMGDGNCVRCSTARPFTGCDPAAAVGCTLTIIFATNGACSSCVLASLDSGRSLRFALVVCGFNSDLQRAEIENDMRLALLAEDTAALAAATAQVQHGEADLAARARRDAPVHAPEHVSQRRDNSALPGTAGYVVSGGGNDGDGDAIALPVDAARVAAWAAHTRCAGVDELRTGAVLRLDGRVAHVVRAPCRGRTSVLLVVDDG